MIFLIAKLEAYGFTDESLKLINSYVTNRKHSTKTKSSYSSFLDLVIGVLQGSIMGTLLLNLYIYIYIYIEVGKNNN